MMAMQLAVGKERFKYFSYFTGLAFAVLPVVAFKHHAPKMIVPLVPLSIIWCWQYDTFYGNLMIRAQREAARTINEEPERYFLPKNTGILDQAKYNGIIGIAADYKPTVSSEGNVFTSLHKNLFG